MEKNNLFSRKEVAAALGVTTNTVYEYERQGFITPVGHVKKSPRYSVESIEAIYTKSNKKVSNG